MSRAMNVGLLVAVLAPWWGASLVATHYITKEETRFEDARRASMVLYVPAGNGGAMYESSHSPTAERAKMYDEMERVALAVLKD